MGMLDLSKLWGSNPPLAQRTAAPNVSSTPRQQDDWGGVASAPSMDDVALGMQIGAAKGGPIRRYAQGGAIPSRATATKFAYGGGAGGNTYTTPGQNYSGVPSGGQMTSLAAMGYPVPSSPYVTTQQQLNTIRYGAASPTAAQVGSSSPTTVSANYAALTPDQQKWYDQASAAIGQANTMPASMQSLAFNGLGAYPTTPTAAAPAPAAATPAPAPPAVQPTATDIVAPAASTTITDPTTTTITGAPGLPNSIQAKSYDPNVDQQDWCWVC